MPQKKMKKYKEKKRKENKSTTKCCIDTESGDEMQMGGMGLFVFNDYKWNVNKNHCLDVENKYIHNKSHRLADRETDSQTDRFQKKNQNISVSKFKKNFF